MLSVQRSHSGCAGRPISEIEFLVAGDASAPMPSYKPQHFSSGSNGQATTRRQLSEVEVQVLGVESPESTRRASSSSVPSTESRHLLPPSLDEVLSSSLPPSLEDVHRAQVYTNRRMSDSSRRRNSDGSSRRRNSDGSSRRRNSDGSSRRRNSDGSSRRQRSLEKQRRATKRSAETISAIEALTEQLRYKGNLEGETPRDSCFDDQFDDELDDYQASRKDTLVSPVQSMSI